MWYGRLIEGGNIMLLLYPLRKLQVLPRVALSLDAWNSFQFDLTTGGERAS